ncbi:hypothetical protein MTO96_031833 [Rhipicephalus appendiculatus]
MADVHSEDSDNSSSKQASATVSSRLSAPRKSPVALTLTRACKVKGAIKRSQPIARTPTSRPRTRGTAKLPATRQRKALQNKATSTGKTQESAATTSGEDATAITPVLRPATLHFAAKEADATLFQGEEQPKEGAPRTEETKEQGQKQTSVSPPLFKRRQRRREQWQQQLPLHIVLLGAYYATLLPFLLNKYAEQPKCSDCASNQSPCAARLSDGGGATLCAVNTLSRSHRRRSGPPPVT